MIVSVPMHALYEKIPITPGESFFYRHFRMPRFEMPWHFHRECELTFIMQARGTRYVGDSIERFDDGDLVLLGSSLPHYWWKDSEDTRPAHSIVIQFDGEAICRDLFGLPEAAAIRGLLSLSARGIRFCGATAEEAARAMNRMAKRTGWRRLSLLLDTFGLLAEEGRTGNRYLASAGYSPVLDERDGQRLRAVCKYVNDAYREDIRQARAASLAGLSPAAFSRYFHKRMGKTFEAYVIEVRVGHACRRLMEEDSTIAEIAFATGFNNLSNFNRHFRKLKAMSPSGYRQNIQVHS